MMMGHMGAWGDWGMGIGWIFMVLVWVLVLLGIVTLVKWLSSSSPNADKPQANSALDILKECYARGEIDHEEYKRKKHDLE